MADPLTPADVEPEHRLESSTGIRTATRFRHDAGASADSQAGDSLSVVQEELQRITGLQREQAAYLEQLEVVFARRSQELLEADEREAALVRRFREQIARIAELERHVREQKVQIQDLQAVLPQRPRGADSALLQVRGIGPKYAKALEALDLGSLEALASLNDADVQRIEQQLRIRNGRIRRERWVEQAQELLARS